MRHQFRKVILSFLVGIILGTQLFGYAEPAHAQFVVSVAADVPRVVDTVLAKVYEGLKVAALNVASTAVGYALRKISYDAAVWIASGGKGQGALVYSKGVGDYLKDVADDAGGHALDALSTQFGTNLCRIPNPQVDLALRTSLRLTYTATTAPPKPSCTITQFYNNNLTQEAWLSRFNTAEKSISQQFNEALTFDTSQGELGIALAAQATVNNSIQSTVTAAAQERNEGQGVKALTDQVSGRVKSPASLVKTELEGISNKDRVNQSGEQINTIISSGQWQLLPGAVANFFLNTLAGTLIKNFQTQGILPFGICIGDTGGPDCKNATAGGTGSFSSAPGGQFTGRQAAEALFSDFLTVHIAQVDQFDILSQLSSCPEEGANTYNCRADSGLVQAAQAVANGIPLSIQDAVNKGFLRGDWKLLPPDNSINTSMNCYTQAYCYSNVKVLRQVRILPLGFEIAAQNSNPDRPWTLSQVLAGFNDCDFIRDGRGTITGINYDPVNKPFCHLIDPNWIIKAPAAKCNAEVYSSSLLSSDVPDRVQSCADLSTCVSYNNDGSCKSYAYCTREQNTWKFNADSCNSQYRTCRSFTNSQGITKSYLARSVDTAYCNKGTVGCTAYSLTQDASGKWMSPTGVRGTTQTGIYFNGSVSKSCGAQSAGCSAFSVAAASDTLLYLRKAPDYLKCYDSNPATPEVDVPQTRADLGRVQGSTECKNYAGVCIPDEMNCNWYTPRNGGTKVPGRYDASTVCNAQCVGYAAYREMPNNYSNGQNISYVIPASGKTCQAAEEGCSAFTNLSVTSGGLEQVEYYSYLRPCSQPDPAQQKNFITYEGTSSGFQLKTYTLVKDTTGGPKYFYRTQADLDQYTSICSEALYKAGNASLDCRQFNDENGQVYYRLLSKTIPVDQKCTPYRLTSAELYPTNLSAAQCTAQKGFYNTKTNQCNLCFQNGEYRDGSCFYYGLPEGQANTAGTSVGCSAAVESCHAYKGDAGNNVRNLFADTFDLTSVPAEWHGSGLAIAAESVRVGGKSLGYTGNSELYRTVTLTPGKSQKITLWAKGTTQTITVSLRSVDGKILKDFGQVTVGDVWNEYQLGPIELAGMTTSSAQLVIKAGATGRLYFDNVELKEISDYIYLVKKTLRVDPSCDSTPNDNLPGEALGCSAYTDPSGNTVNLTGFNYLCRENAIGCSALFDTHNTPGDTQSHTYNVRLLGAGGSTPSVTLGKDAVSCTVPGGNTGCYVTITGHEPREIQALSGVQFTSSTVYVPGDTASSTPLYLVADQSSTCNAADLGCSYAGVETQTPTGPQYQTTLIKNDPSTYTTTLCQAESVGCSAYSGTEGTSYFKDPSLTGNKICAYRTGVTINGVKSDGWFWKGVGVCSTDKTKYCSLDQDCGSGATCTGISDQPCYPTYITSGNNYGLWSSGDGSKYQNFVGECPAQQNMCTEFIDHADQDKSYYLLKNSKISQGNCDGKVSQRAGCALFDETDQPNKFFSTKASYDASTANQFQLVQPIASTTASPSDANTIIQVNRDRQCAEWLQCRSSHRVWDAASAQWKDVCDAIGRCDQTPENPQQDSISNCAHWIEQDPMSPPQALTPEQYVKRDVTWQGNEYDGFSILNLFPPDSLSQVNISSDPKHDDWRLTRVLPCGNTNCLATGSGAPETVKCKDNNAPCGQGGVGLCINGTCMQNLDGTNKDVLDGARAQSCRAYPEKNSPFPNSTFIDTAKSKFTQAAICNEIGKPSSDPVKAMACDCDYTKVLYGDISTKYFRYTLPYSTEDVIPGATSDGTLPKGICLSGSHDGYACKTDNDCFKTDSGEPGGKEVLQNGVRITDGTCQKSKQNYKLLGWHGYCLEYDTSRSINGNVNDHPCLTWYPIDHLVGTTDINNQHPTAGYNPPATTGGTGGSLYCIEANGAGGAGDQSKTTFPMSRAFKARDVSVNVDTEGDGQFARKSYTAAPNEAVINMADIERVDFKVIGDPAADRGRVDPIIGTTFSIWPNAVNVPANAPQALYHTAGHTRALGTTVTGKYLGHADEFVVAYGSKISEEPTKPDTYVKENGAVCYPSVVDGRLGTWELNTGVCKLSGNVFTTMYSAGTDLGPDGIWNTSYSTNDICQPYAPTGATKASQGQGNWHAIRMRFDPITKNVAGYDIAYCKQDINSEKGQIRYEVTFHLRQWCRAVADVGSTLEQAQASAPWTNRLYQASGYSLQIYDPMLGSSGPKYTYANEQAPFASLSLNTLANPLNALLFSSRQLVPNCDAGKCSETGLDQRTITPNLLVEQDTEKAVNGGPYSCVTGQCVVKTSTGEVEAPSAVENANDNAIGLTYLNQLFARVNKTYTYLITSRSASYQGPGLPSDITETADEIPKPPLIFPVGACDNDNKCVEDDSSVGFSINGQSKGTIPFFTSSARVFLKFFMFADQDHMPVKNVTVNWGDGAVYGLPGMYENSRGSRQSFCALAPGAVNKTCQVTEIDDSSPCKTTADCGVGGSCIFAAPGAPFGKCLKPRSLGMTCQNDSQCQQVSTCADSPNSFGKIKDKTCDTNYVQFDHVYQCYPGQTNYTEDPAACGNGLTKCCIYTPQVQVKDNWGWCTGVCRGGPGKDGCYSKPGADECLSGGFIPFNGKIVVAPTTP